jgi:two-component system, chemotaxis family, protein-glutamate methylesterase/glutaminase
VSEPRQRRIRVLVVDDSRVARELLMHVLETDPQIEVIGTAASGAEAIEAVKQKKPDVVTMDYLMPDMNGLDATRSIMEIDPVPIVIVSAMSSRSQVAHAHALLEAGALAVLEKPAGPGHPRYAASADELLETVKWVSEVKVVKRGPRRGARGAASPAAAATLKASGRRLGAVAVGASTGGPIVLKSILSGLRRDFPVPILIVQHIAPGFTRGLVDWLAQSSGFSVRVAAAGESLVPGRAYVAPDGFHMKLAPERRVALSDEAPLYGHRPSVAHLFRSVAQVLNCDAIGVLLTGMGKDGAEELRLMKEAGAVTIAQDHDTSIVHGMPGEAIQLDAATHVLPADSIANALNTLTTEIRGSR